MASVKPVKNAAVAADPALKSEPKKVVAKASKPIASVAPKVLKAPKAPPALKVVKAVAAATDMGESATDEGESVGALGRSDIALAIREKCKAENIAVPEKLAVALVRGFESVVAEAVAAGRDINLPGFGKFTVKLRLARMGRNPQTGVDIAIGASYSPVFKPGKLLKDSANSRDASSAAATA